MDIIETLIKVIKQQAEIFLLDAGEFFPFGTCIGKANDIIPIAAYIEDPHDRPESLPLINMLDGMIKEGIINGEYIIGALAYDILVKEDQKKFDAIMMRIYENDNFVERYFKYDIHETQVDFY